VLHLRVIAPPDRTDDVTAFAVDSAACANLVVFPGAARSPSGDLVQFDVAREAANGVLDRLRELGIPDSGSISVEQIDVSISAGADAAEEAAPGFGDDAVVWDELDARTADDATLSWAFLAFLALATQIAGIGTLLDQPILIVGAMVLGPEFGAVAAICFGIMRRDAHRVAVATRTLVVGFTVSIAVTLVCALVSRWLGWIDGSMLDDRTLTTFIIHPDKFSFIVAVLAGIAGILSITAGKSSALVGVFISVTTVPAAGNIAVAVALGHWSEVGSSAVQLGVNLGGMLVAGLATLLLQRALWRRYGMRIAARPNAAVRRRPAR
jgi:uncharacterized hydrophobic protein (TIGR00271 family)